MPPSGESTVEVTVVPSTPYQEEEEPQGSYGSGENMDYYYQHQAIQNIMLVVPSPPKDKSVSFSRPTPIQILSNSPTTNSDGTPRPPPSFFDLVCCSPMRFFRFCLSKWRGEQCPAPQSSPPTWTHSFVSLFQAFTCISLLDYLSNYWSAHEQDRLLIIASFGASAVLMYSAIRSPLSQPRNLVVGHVVSAIVGVTIQKIIGPYIQWLAASLAVGLSIFIMERTRCLHPPGGATALIAVIGSENIHRQGYFFVIAPCFLGPVIMLLLALSFNNLDPTRQYPMVWDFSPFMCPTCDGPPAGKGAQGGRHTMAMDTEMSYASSMALELCETKFVNEWEQDQQQPQ